MDLESFLNTHNFLLQIFLWAKRPNKVYGVWSFLVGWGLRGLGIQTFLKNQDPPWGFKIPKLKLGFLFLSHPPPIKEYFPNFCIYFSDASPPLSCFLAAQKALDLLEGGLRFDM